jgi:hypothetical protein
MCVVMLFTLSYVMKLASCSVFGRWDTYFLFLVRVSKWMTALWSSGQSSCLQIQRSRVWFPALQNFLRSSGSGTGFTQPHEYNEELLGRNSSGTGLENREYGRGDPLHWPRDTFYPQKLPLTSPSSGGRSIGIVFLRIKATEFVFIFV